MIRAGGAVHEVPRAQLPLLAFDQQHALSRQHEEVLLQRLGVIEPARLPRLEHGERVTVDVEVVVRALFDPAQALQAVGNRVEDGPFGRSGIQHRRIGIEQRLHKGRHVLGARGQGAWSAGRD